MIEVILGIVIWLCFCLVSAPNFVHYYTLCIYGNCVSRSIMGLKSFGLSATNNKQWKLAGREDLLIDILMHACSFEYVTEQMLINSMALSF